jgi:hypothetical protein
MVEPEQRQDNQNGASVLDLSMWKVAIVLASGDAGCWQLRLLHLFPSGLNAIFMGNFAPKDIVYPI